MFLRTKNALTIGANIKAKRWFKKPTKGYQL